MNGINDFHHPRRRRSTRSKIGDALLTAGVIMGATGIIKSIKNAEDKPTTGAQYCGECGTKNETAANFCAECGHKLVQIDK